MVKLQAIAFDISKVFDRVWHADLLHKLKGYGISGWIFELIQSFLSIHEIKIVLNGHSSRSFSINVSVSHDSIFGPTLFLIFVNDLPGVISSQLLLFTLVLRASLIGLIRSN